MSAPLPATPVDAVRADIDAQIDVAIANCMSEIYRLLFVEEGIQAQSLLIDVKQIASPLGDIIAGSIRRIREDWDETTMATPMLSRESREKVFKARLGQF